jgi:predicted transcriptional regulator
MLAEVNVPTMEWAPTVTVSDELRARVDELAARPGGAEALNLSDKQERNQALAALREDVQDSWRRSTRRTRTWRPSRCSSARRRRR